MTADAAHPNPEVARRLAHIYTLHRTDIDLRLGQSPYIQLLDKLGNPHKNLPPAVHVAGTNGKGSVLAFLRAMCEAAGYRVHVYTSPHLVTFNERIRLGGDLVSDDELIRLYDRVEKTNGGAAITFFEFTTAMAFLAFAAHEADVILLETGMGGRLDCTNVIEKPAVTAITKISFDHTEFLGDSLEKIAAEKAGIMKPGVPCVIGAQMDMDAVWPVFEQQARALNAPLIRAGALPPGYPAPSLVGLHQRENAATALAIADVLPLRLDEDARKKGLAGADWPARLQRIVSSDPAPGWEVWFDAAHNDSGALALAQQLQIWKQENPRKPIHLVVGLAADKDVDAFFGALAGWCDSITLVDLPVARKPQKARDLQARARLPRAMLAGSVDQALRQLTAAQNPGRVVVCGSLYLYQTVI